MNKAINQMVKTLAVLAVAGGFAAVANAADEELRVTTSINDKIPTVQEVEGALFPDQMATQKAECEQLEKVGLRCQSVIPKSSLDSVQVTFARGSAKLTAEGKEFLNMIGKALQKRVTTWKSVAIEGHTDATGTSETNSNLSKARADSVKSYLQTTFGLKNIETVGRGSERLKDTTNPGSELNRRVEFVPTW
jgi:outer membrane protein OmpA-like peptidoglycan-associated protein